MSSDACHTSKAPQKLRLADLQVQSLSPPWTSTKPARAPVATPGPHASLRAFAASINLCENPLYIHRTTIVKHTKRAAQH